MSGRLFLRPLIYLAIIVATISYGILLNSATIAAMLGSAIAAIDNIEFVVLTILGLIALRKFDILVIAIVASILRSLVLVAGTRGFRAELGIADLSYWEIIVPSFLAFVAVLSSAAFLFSSFNILRYGESK